MGEQESFRRGQVEALLMIQLDTLSQMLSEHLCGDAAKLAAELDVLRRMILECLRDEGQDADRSRSQARHPGEQRAEP
jgi:hypothetical protein